MFSKKCDRCNKQVERKFSFCPNCGFSLKKKSDYGLLGDKDDFLHLQGSSPSEGFSEGIFEKLIGSAFKMIEKEMRGISEEERRKKSEMLPSNFQLFVNGKKVNLSDSQEIRRKAQPAENSFPEISEQLIKESAELPRKEAKSKLSRIGNKVVYELETPGLKTIKNVLINKLESSIEIRAYTDKAVYFKTLPGKLPLVRYSVMSDGKLVVEFGS